MSDIRGFLAANLQCWHRLSSEESDQLVTLFEVKTAEVDALRKDAERYQWLREHASFCDFEKKMQLPVFKNPIHDFDNDWKNHLWDTSVNATIDAAINGEKVA